jgi:hypothetical protein
VGPFFAGSHLFSSFEGKKEEKVDVAGATFPHHRSKTTMTGLFLHTLPV